VLLHEGGELRHELGVAAGGEVGVDAQLQRLEPLLLEPRDLGGGERERSEIGQRRATPQRERVLQRLGRGAGVPGLEGPPALGDQPREAVGVDLGGVRPDRVARGGGDQDVLAAERPPQARDVHLHGLGRRGRRVLAPQRERDALGAHRLARAQEQQREQPARLRAAERQRAAVVAHLERAEDGELHGLGSQPTSGC
jgi:hypothetical protein